MVSWPLLLNEAEREVTELRAENERLKEAFANSEAACLIQVQMVRAENERLRAEVADLLPRLDADAMHINNLVRELKQADAEIERLRAALAKATWLLEGTADQIDEWFPGDKNPTVQTDLRRFAGQWQQDFGLLTAQQALAPHKECYD